MNDLVSLGAIFDWTATIRASAENVLAGDAVALACPLSCPQSMARIEAEFEVWGRMFLHDCYVFSVHAVDAKAVQKIIDEECG